MNELKQLKTEYDILRKYFGIYSESWSMLHERFNP